MTVKVNVNRNVIAANRKNGTNEPPFSIYRSGKRVERALEVRLEGDVRLVYRPDKPLNCGATVWLEAEAAYPVTALVPSGQREAA